MSAVTRTIEIKDINPAELAQVFCGMCAEEQAAFFAAIHEIAAEWPGAGWCQQACAIAGEVGPKSREVITKLAEHVLGYDEVIDALRDLLSAPTHPPSRRLRRWRELRPCGCDPH